MLKKLPPILLGCMALLIAVPAGKAVKYAAVKTHP